MGCIRAFAERCDCPDCNPPQQERRWKILRKRTEGPFGAVLAVIEDAVVGPDTDWIEVMPVADHKAQLEQAIEEFAERLAGELERLMAERRERGHKSRAMGLEEAVAFCRTLATEGRE